MYRCGKCCMDDERLHCEHHTHIGPHERLNHLWCDAHRMDARKRAEQPKETIKEAIYYCGGTRARDDCRKLQETGLHTKRECVCDEIHRIQKPEQKGTSPARRDQTAKPNRRHAESSRDYARSNRDDKYRDRRGRRTKERPRGGRTYYRNSSRTRRENGRTKEERDRQIRGRKPKVYESTHGVRKSKGDTYDRRDQARRQSERMERHVERDRMGRHSLMADPVPRRNSEGALTEDDKYANASNEPMGNISLSNVRKTCEAKPKSEATLSIYTLREKIKELTSRITQTNLEINNLRNQRIEQNYHISNTDRDNRTSNKTGNNNNNSNTDETTVTITTEVDKTTDKATDKASDELDEVFNSEYEEIIQAVEADIQKLSETIPLEATENETPAAKTIRRNKNKPMLRDIYKDIKSKNSNQKTKGRGKNLDNK